MDTISPVVVDAFRLPHTDLYGHLDMAEFLASKAAGWHDGDIEAARNLIPDLVVSFEGCWSNMRPSQTASAGSARRRGPVPW